MSWTETQVDYERHIRRSAILDTVEQAFAFCLTGIEEETIDLPVISVEPMMIYTDDDPDGIVRFEATVSGQSPRRAEGARPPRP